MSVGIGGGTSIGPGWKNGPMIVLKKKYKSGGKVEIDFLPRQAVIYLDLVFELKCW